MEYYERRFKTNIHSKIRFLGWLTASPFVLGALAGLATMKASDGISIFIAVGCIIGVAVVLWFNGILRDIIQLQEEKAVILESIMLQQGSYVPEPVQQPAAGYPVKA